MRKTSVQGIRVLRRVSEFLVDNTATGRLGPIEKQVKELNACLARLEQYGDTQDGAMRGYQDATTNAREASRALLREGMQPIARLAALFFPRRSAERAGFNLPKGRGYDRMLRAAAGFAERATEHKAKFIEAGLGEDFVERLQGAAVELRKALTEKEKHYGRRIAASEGAEVEFARAKKLVAYLDTMVTPIWEATPTRLKEWKGLARFARPSAPSEETPQEAPVPTTTGERVKDEHRTA